MKKVITRKLLSCSLVSTMSCLRLITSRERSGPFPRVCPVIHQQNDDLRVGSVLKNMCVHLKEGTIHLLGHCSCLRVRHLRLVCIHFLEVMVFFQPTLLRHTQTWCSRASIWFEPVTFFKSISHSSFLSLGRLIHWKFTKRLGCAIQHPLPATSILVTLPL